MRRVVAGVLPCLFLGTVYCAVPEETAKPSEEDPYRVVWTTPSADPNGSMPLGNGDIGVNLWVEESGALCFYIGKTDAWSENGRLLKVGRIRLHLTPNPFEGAESFRQTLDVRTGDITVEVGKGDARTVLRVWVDALYPAVRIEAEGTQPFDMAADLEIWRTNPRELSPEELHSAYGLAGSPEPVVVEPDTVVEGPGDCVTWFHRNERSIWADTLRHQGMAAWLPEGRDPLLYRTFGAMAGGSGFVRESATRLRSASPASKHRLAVYVLTAQTPGSAEWVKRASRLAAADTRSWETAAEAHRAWWRSFWERSWIRLSGENVAHINQGYVLQRFISACAGRGGSPIKFNGSIFTVDAEFQGKRFDADFRQWGGPYWFQNTRLPYWPMLASGDFDMMRPLFRMYKDALPFAKARTQTYFGHDGAFFPETMYFWAAYANDNYGWKREGLPVGVTENRYIRYYYSGALELLCMMLDHYAYTEDTAFLEEEVMPLAQAVLTFYDKHYPRDENGKLRLEPAQALETWQDVVNPLPPIAGLGRVLGLLLALPEGVAGADDRAFWQALTNSLPTLPMEDVDGERVLAAAEKILEDAGNSENPELYAVFPYRLFGVGKPDIDVARRSFARRRVKGNEGWRQDETQAAFLGLTQEARERLAQRYSMKHAASRFPAFWGPNFDWIPDQDHGGNAVMALQTMLLQAEGRRMLLFPAWPKEWDVNFKLHAPGKTTLEGAYRAGKLVRLTVEPPERQADVVILETQQ